MVQRKRERSNHDIPLKDDSPVTAADIVSDLCGEAFVVHEEKVYFPNVVDNEFLEAAGKEMACLEVP